MTNPGIGDASRNIDLVAEAGSGSRPIGKGGMGEVWLAWDGGLHRNVALKLLRLGDRADAEMVRRFEREARAASQLRGPHTVQIYDFGASDDGIYYLAMEYLDGRTSGRWFRSSVRSRRLARSVSSFRPASRWPRPMTPVLSTATSSRTTSS